MRSKLEESVGKWLFPKGAVYEEYVFFYSIPKKYTPDFTLEDYRIHIEIKGWFRQGDRQKYAAINEEMKEQGWTYVFILQNPHKPVSKGAKSTMADWCDKHGIPWFAADSLNDFEDFLDELEFPDANH